MGNLIVSKLEKQRSASSEVFSILLTSEFCMRSVKLYQAVWSELCMVLDRPSISRILQEPRDLGE